MNAEFQELAMLLGLAALVVVPAVVLRIRRLRAPLRRLRQTNGPTRRAVGLVAAREGEGLARRAVGLVAARDGEGLARRAVGLAAVGAGLARLAASDPRRLMVVGATGASGIGLVTGGLVAAVVGAVYAVMLVRAVSRAMRRRAAASIRTSSLDELCSLAGDLRAGLPPTACRTTGLADRRLADLTAAVWRLAERTGAPAADLVERIEDDARAADRATASAQAQAAGAQMTALLLAALPLAGIGLGYSIGADPLQVLLETKLGAACALSAVVLQVAGLLWCDRMMAGATR
ncbi:hypothetical protein AB0M54_11680 [Actinoplanes sp. NPDC051470]|uniref:hypothetical protein n=1 Tax=Actinoplanes sp. NPDC051470 TaxID=3157224 RepID=UPI003416A728